ncbi:MAG: chemotaxis protein CheB [Cellvibrionaceae bacterium]
MSGHPLRIGLLAHNQVQHRTLRSLVEQCGHQVGRCLLISQLESEVGAAHTVAAEQPSEPMEADAPQAWIAAIDPDSAEGDGENGNLGNKALDEWLDAQHSVVIFCDGRVPANHDEQYEPWSRRLKEKLNHLAGTINLAQENEGSARQVWVLAASTGGPAAVKQFLAELPPKLGIGFIYVQHIDTGFKDTLAQVMSRSQYSARIIEHGSVVRPDEVAIVSPDYATELLPNGTFLVSEKNWSAPYSPSADYIIANVAHSYGERSGVIIFTGMGNDGAAGSRLMRQKGGKVWVQTPGSCTSDSMPVATLATGSVGFKGSPYTLAQELVREVQTARQQQPAASVEE